MCDTKHDRGKCQKPENLKDVPDKCTPEQIEKCHGDSVRHPCTRTEEDE